MTKIEEVALAIYNSKWVTANSLADLSYESRDEAIKAARAAIEAMREPTDGMVKAMEENLFEHLPDARDWTITLAKEGWQSAVDAALNEKP